MMLKLLIAAVLSSATFIPGASMAQEATTAIVVAPPQKGFALKDKDGRSLGRINLVRVDAGYLTYIDSMTIYRVPLATVSVKGRVATTTMARSDITR